jgi:hypothetical protein
MSRDMRAPRTPMPMPIPDDPALMDDATMPLMPPMPMERGQMPPMPMDDPALMAGATDNPLAAMPPEAREALMQPDENIQAVLLARLANMTPGELQLLDTVITPEVARVLMKLLPELDALVSAVEANAQMVQAPPVNPGAFGNI